MLKTITSYGLGVALVSLALCLPVRAEPGETTESVEVGTGVLCDTQAQMERFVALLDGDAMTALRAVNAEENDSNACGVATIAFIRGPEGATARTKAGTYQIMEVLVVGVFVEGAFRAAVPAKFFSARKIDERTA